MPGPSPCASHGHPGLFPLPVHSYNIAGAGPGAAPSPMVLRWGSAQHLHPREIHKINDIHKNISISILTVAIPGEWAPAPCWEGDVLPDTAVMGFVYAGMEGHGGGVLQEVEAVSCSLTSCVAWG